MKKYTFKKLADLVDISEDHQRTFRDFISMAAWWDSVDVSKFEWTTGLHEALADQHVFRFGLVSHLGFRDRKFWLIAKKLGANTIASGGDTSLIRGLLAALMELEQPRNGKQTVARDACIVFGIGFGVASGMTATEGEKRPGREVKSATRLAVDQLSDQLAQSPHTVRRLADKWTIREEILINAGFSQTTISEFFDEITRVAKARI